MLKWKGFGRRPSYPNRGRTNIQAFSVRSEGNNEIFGCKEHAEPSQKGREMHAIFAEQITVVGQRYYG
jgi:hypothetical protein